MTIIVLLILAGVTIATLTGDNGILTKATEAKLENEYASVKEGIGLAVSEYNTLKYAGGEQNDEFLSWLQSKGYTDANNTVNTQNLLNQTLSTGNGEATGTKDVYKIEETEENVYVLVYYDEDGNRKELSTFTLDSSDSLEETDESYFVITDDGTISLKDYDEYYHNVKEWTIENLVIPKKVNGVEVKKIGDRMFYAGGTGYSNISQNLKTVVIPDTVIEIGNSTFYNCYELNKIIIPDSVTKIGTYAFYGCGLQDIDLPNQLTIIGSDTFSRCNSLTSIIIPSTVKEMGQDVFWYWNSTQTIYIEFVENEIPDTWDSDWLRNCEAEVIYGYKPE